MYFRYMANTETYLKNVALKHMPPNLQKVDLLRSGKNVLFPVIQRGQHLHARCLQVLENKIFTFTLFSLKHENSM